VNRKARTVHQPGDRKHAAVFGFEDSSAGDVAGAERQHVPVLIRRDQTVVEQCRPAEGLEDAGPAAMNDAAGVNAERGISVAQLKPVSAAGEVEAGTEAVAVKQLSVSAGENGDVMIHDHAAQCVVAVASKDNRPSARA
jgi:hypothetical protein